MVVFSPGTPSTRRAGLTLPLRPTGEDDWKPGWGTGSQIPGAPIPPCIPLHGIVCNDGLVLI